MKMLPLILLALLVAACSGKKTPMPPALAAMPAAEREELMQGRELYHLRKCVRCHGITGRGDGERAWNMVPPPFDFRQTNAYLQGASLEAIAETIRTGVTNVKSAMPKAPFLTPEERRSIARYVIHMRTFYK